MKLRRALEGLRRIRGVWRGEADRAFLLAAALALLLCLAKPTWTLDRARVSHVVVLDVTQSMNVTDQQIDGRPVSRLDYAKHALRHALLQLPCGSKVGWGLFTEYRSYLLFTPVEVCANLSELRATLAHIDGGMAWTGNSEVAKGLYSGIGIAGQLPGPASLVFITDGQEAPPLNARHRPAFNGKRGEIGGLIVGVGDLLPSPIPKTDPQGRRLGFWGADEVMQTDTFSRGRSGSVGAEKMAEDGDAPAAALPGATPGSEHLSSLREAYLRLLAGETGLGFLRLQDPAVFSDALNAPALAQPVPLRADLRPVLAVLALVCLLLRHLAWRFRTGQTRRSAASPPRRAPTR